MGPVKAGPVRHLEKPHLAGKVLLRTGTELTAEMAAVAVLLMDLITTEMLAETAETTVKMVREVTPIIMITREAEELPHCIIQVAV